MTESRKRKRLLATVLLGAALLAAGCSSGADGKPAATTVKTGSSTDPLLQHASANLDKYSTAPTSIGITDPLKTLPRGKTVYYMECGAALCQQIGDAMVTPARLLGSRLVRINIALTAQSISAAWDKAAQENPML